MSVLIRWRMIVPVGVTVRVAVRISIVGVFIVRVVRVVGMVGMVVAVVVTMCAVMVLMRMTVFVHRVRVLFAGFTFRFVR